MGLHIKQRAGNIYIYIYIQMWDRSREGKGGLDHCSQRKTKWNLVCNHQEKHLFLFLLQSPTLAHAEQQRPQRRTPRQIKLFSSTVGRPFCNWRTFKQFIGNINILQKNVLCWIFKILPIPFDFPNLPFKGPAQNLPRWIAAVPPPQNMACPAYQ